jgi:hypothetical protein
MEDKENAQPKLTLAYLPWIVAGVALVIYLWTLNHWVTLFSLPVVAQVTGWDWWSIKINSPIHYAVTFPVSFLPPDWQPVVLNILAVLFAVLTLALLARSVALLPHDRTREQRMRERSNHALLSIRTAWLPPVFAVLVCGLQLSFWEHATAGTGEMLNLLMFAYVIRCLLEYRISENESWLSRMALVYVVTIVSD